MALTTQFHLMENTVTTAVLTRPISTAGQIPLHTRNLTTKPAPEHAYVSQLHSYPVRHCIKDWLTQLTSSLENSPGSEKHWDAVDEEVLQALIFELGLEKLVELPQLELSNWELQEKTGLAECRKHNEYIQHCLPEKNARESHDGFTES